MEQKDGQLTRELLYEGRIVQFSIPAAEILQSRTLEYLRRFTLELDIFDEQQNARYLANLHRIRELVRGDVEIRGSALQALESAGINLAGVYADDVRFRCIPPNFQEHPQASGLLCWHRDTFYSNASCQINLWIPLTACDRSNGIAFFPDYLDVAVKNNSAGFSLNQWNEAGGFQAFSESETGVKASTGLTYPSALVSPDLDRAFCPEVGPGHALLFASRHLHGTMPNLSGRNRYSLASRFCVVEDLQKADPALNVDNGSAGCFTREFRHAHSGERCPEWLCDRYERLTTRPAG